MIFITNAIIIPIIVSKTLLKTKKYGFLSLRWFTTILKKTTHEKYVDFFLFINTVVYITGINNIDIDKYLIKSLSNGKK